LLKVKELVLTESGRTRESLSFQFPYKSQELEIHMKSISRDLTKRRVLPGESLARVYFSKIG
jgi:hypothetical protein